MEILNGYHNTFEFDINTRTNAGATLLFCDFFDLPFLEWLLNRGIDIHIKDNNGRDAVSWSASLGETNQVFLLLDHGASLKGLRATFNWSDADLRTLTRYERKETSCGQLIAGFTLLKVVICQIIWSTRRDESWYLKTKK